MKVLNTVVKVVLALAAVAGAVYVIATYGDKIVAWAKKLLGCTECPIEEDAPVEAVVEAAEEVPCQEEAAPAEEAEPAEETAAEVVAAEADFEG